MIITFNTRLSSFFGKEVVEEFVAMCVKVVRENKMQCCMTLVMHSIVLTSKFPSN